MFWLHARHDALELERRESASKVAPAHWVLDGRNATSVDKRVFEEGTQEDGQEQ